MQRSYKKTVTQIPVLIPCDARDRQGWATWIEGQAVRLFTEADLVPKGGKNPLRTLSEADRKFFLAVVGLLQALQENDPTAIDRARQRVIEALGQKESVDLGSEEIQRAAAQLGLKPGQETMVLELFVLTPGASQDIHWLSSSVVSMLLDPVRLVLWWYKKRFRPALYCVDLKSALLTFALVRIVGGKGFGLCPQCGTFFVQRRSDQSYCTIAHREAHRVARWRASKATRTKKKGRKNGTRKTR